MRKKLESLREREAIRLLTRIYGRHDFPLGYEDDVAAVPISPRLWIIVKGDMLVRSTDIPPGMTLSEAGRKSIVSTVSDFAAKGVRPKANRVHRIAEKYFQEAAVRNRTGPCRGSNRIRLPNCGG